jgi:hypothetical protein
MIPERGMSAGIYFSQFPPGDLTISKPLTVIPEVHDRKKQPIKTTAKMMVNIFLSMLVGLVVNK